MAFVIDASIAACWAFDDESHLHADLASARLRRDQAETPSLWWFELRNILIVNERRGRITQASAADFLRDLSLLDIQLDRSPKSEDVLRLARTHSLSAYDAAYLELAKRRAFDLATLDSALTRAARKEAVKVVGIDV